jgi:hypothetical protein
MNKTTVKISEGMERSINKKIDLKRPIVLKLVDVDNNDNDGLICPYC